MLHHRGGYHAGPYFEEARGLVGSKIWFGRVSCSLFPIYKTNPNPRKIFTVGKRGLNATFNLVFLGVGLALGWGVRRFHSNIQMFSNPTEFVNRKHPIYVISLIVLGTGCYAISLIVLDTGRYAISLTVMATDRYAISSIVLGIDRCGILDRIGYRRLRYHNSKGKLYVFQPNMICKS